MRIFITRWGLDSYLEHRDSGVITRELYYEQLRPDILRLRHRDTDPKFQQPSFWGPAIGPRGRVDEGWKMKWHNLGPGRLQLRLCVAVVEADAYLCHAYVKTSPAQDRRRAARLRDQIRLIRKGVADIRGEL